MLNFDMAGRVIEPGRLKKSMGGDFDTRGTPSLFSIPTTGDFSNVTVSDSSDEYLAKEIQRPTATPGPALVHGPDVSLGSDMVGMRVSAKVIGGGSGWQAAYGATARDFFVGFKSSDGQNGIFLEYLGPENENTGAWITGRSGGVDNGTFWRRGYAKEHQLPVQQPF